VVKINKTTLLALALTMTGCVTPYSETPTAKNFATTPQEKLQAASHWAIITGDLAQKVQSQMSGKMDKEQPLYISAKNNSPFNQTVVNELISTLVGSGYNVVKSPENTTKINVDTQVLKFSPNRLQAKMVGLPTALTAGVWAIAETGISGSSAGAIATTLVAGAEALSYINSDKASGNTPRTEIITNISVEDNNKYIAVSRGTYYVSDTDKWLYQAAETHNFNVRGN
jgi:Ni,Fe-hydrogenase III small subunit